MTKPITALICAVLVFMFGPAAVAFAVAPPPVDVDSTSASTIAIAAPLVTIVVSLLIPLINGFLTTASTPVAVKAIGTIVLNAAAALFSSSVLADGTAAFSSTTLYTALLGTIISITMYAGVYKPLNVTSNAGGSLATVGRS